MSMRFGMQVLASLSLSTTLSGSMTLTQAEAPPRRVVLFVVDGAGIGIWSITRYQQNGHLMEEFPVLGLVDTRAVDGYYPGSASAATSFATGVRSFVRAIGVGPDSQPRESVIEVAGQNGLATGLVTTARITDATPAAFSAHTAYRIDEPGIARQQLDQKITVFLGGGRMHFDASTRPDSLDLIRWIRQRHTYVETGEELQSLALDSVTSLYGLFSDSDMALYPERSPSLAQMASAALTVLSKDPEGFFLLLETENTDTETHDNVEYDILSREMTDVLGTIGVLLEYQRSNPETLFILLGDHDTGGLAIQRDTAAQVLRRAAAHLDTGLVQLGETASLLDSTDAALLDSTRALMGHLSTALLRRAGAFRDETVLVARYTTGSHTANMVPLFAVGPESNRFSGVIDNDNIGQLLLEIVARNR